LAPIEYLRFTQANLFRGSAVLAHNNIVKQSEPKRAVRPAIAKPGTQVVFKKVSHIPPGGIVCTVSYLKSSENFELQAPKRRFLGEFMRILSRFRGVLIAKLGRFAAKWTVS
jgi:hypothetical protein